jgi:hypothetical protein
VTVSSQIVADAPVFSVVADVVIVKGETPAADWTWLSFPDGTARQAAVHVVYDLPHLVIESVFELRDGLWGTLAETGVAPVPRAASRRYGHLRLVTDTPAHGLAGMYPPGHALAKAAVTAILNRWRDGPDTPAGVRERLRACGPDADELADDLDDESIRVAAAGVKRLYREWALLPPGGRLRLTWPLHDSWLRLM